MCGQLRAGFIFHRKQLSKLSEAPRSWTELRAQAIKYVRRTEQLIRCRLALVSTSPQCDDTILVPDPFAG